MKIIKTNIQENTSNRKNFICVPHIYNCGIPLMFLNNPFPVKSCDIPGFIKIISGY